MKAWFAIPSIRPVIELDAILALWKERGYGIAVLRQGAPSALAHLTIPTGEYLGWARSTNILSALVFGNDPEAQFCIAGGDDYAPDLCASASDVAEECVTHFGGTFGVCQPTGDRWQERNGEAVIDRIAGSPWMGKDWCARAYQGFGPMFSGYWHNFSDEELQCVAQKLGVFWQRRDLIHEHRHWARPRGDVRDMPEWARKINDPAHSDWDKSKALFAARKAAGFPGHEPLEA